MTDLSSYSDNDKANSNSSGNSTVITSATPGSIHSGSPRDTLTNNNSINNNTNNILNNTIGQDPEKTKELTSLFLGRNCRLSETWNQLKSKKVFSPGSTTNTTTTSTLNLYNMKRLASPKAPASPLASPLPTVQQIEEQQKQLGLSHSSGYQQHHTQHPHYHHHHQGRFQNYHQQVNEPPLDTRPTSLSIPGHRRDSIPQQHLGQAVPLPSIEFVVPEQPQKLQPQQRRSSGNGYWSSPSPPNDRYSNSSSPEVRYHHQSYHSSPTYLPSSFNSHHRRSSSQYYPSDHRRTNSDSPVETPKSAPSIMSEDHYMNAMRSKIGKPTRQRHEKDRRFNHGRWTQEEHELFVKAFQVCGRDWSRIAREFVTTRMRSQVASHAQKYLMKIEAERSGTDLSCRSNSMMVDDMYD